MGASDLVELLVLVAAFYWAIHPSALNPEVAGAERSTTPEPD